MVKKSSVYFTFTRKNGMSVGGMIDRYNNASTI